MKELLRLLGSLSPNLMDKPLTYRGLKCLLEDAIAQGNLRAFEEFAAPVPAVDAPKPGYLEALDPGGRFMSEAEKSRWLYMKQRAEDEIYMYGPDTSYPGEVGASEIIALIEIALEEDVACPSTTHTPTNAGRNHHA